MFYYIGNIRGLYCLVPYQAPVVVHAETCCKNVFLRRVLSTVIMANVAPLPDSWMKKLLQFGVLTHGIQSAKRFCKASRLRDTLCFLL